MLVHLNLTWEWQAWNEYARRRGFGNKVQWPVHMSNVTDNVTVGARPSDTMPRNTTEMRKMQLWKLVTPRRWANHENVRDLEAAPPDFSHRQVHAEWLESDHDPDEKPWFPWNQPPTDEEIWQQGGKDNPALRSHDPREGIRTQLDSF